LLINMNIITHKESERKSCSFFFSNTQMLYPFRKEKSSFEITFFFDFFSLDLN
jgi:hypothetical protein